MKRVKLLLLSAVVSLIVFGTGASAATAKPAASTRPASALSPSGATLNGSVNGRGRVTTYFFNYGLTTRYGLRTPKASAGTPATSVAVSAPIAGLNPDTTYHFQAVARTSAGTTAGNDRSFHTPPIPTVSTISVAPNPVVFGGFLTVTGALVGPPNEGGKQVALEANVFPYTGGFRQVGNTVLTTPQGAYSFTVVPLIVTTQLRVVDRSMPSVVSPVVTEQVAVQVTLAGRRTRGRHRRGRMLRFGGIVAPGHPDARVAIEVQRRNGSWRTVGTTRTRARSASQSTFTKTLRVRGRGRYRAFVFVADGNNVSGASSSILVH